MNKYIKKLSKVISLPFLLGILFINCQSNYSETNRSLKSDDRKVFMNPDDYIVSEYNRGTEVLILADHHFIKENVDFVSSLIPKLHQNGVRLFFSEFHLHRDSLLIDELMKKQEFDVKLAEKLSHNMLYQWGYQEYIDLMKAFWEINHRLPESDWIHLIGTAPYMQWEIFNSEEDFNDPEKRKTWGSWDGMSYEKKWAFIVAEGSLEKGEKAFVFCGFHHGMTGFKQPIVIDGDFKRFDDRRMGHYLFNRYGKRVKTILTHYPWNPRKGYNKGYVLPFQGALDLLADKHGSFGIDSYELPELIDSMSIYSNGYNRLRLPQLCDGYVVIKPICEQNVVTSISNFIGEHNLAESKRQAYRMRDEKYTAASINDSIQAWLNEIKLDISAICIEN